MHECAVQGCLGPVKILHVRNVEFYGKVEIPVCEEHYKRAFVAEEKAAARKRAEASDDLDYIAGRGRYSQ